MVKYLLGALTFCLCFISGLAQSYDEANRHQLGVSSAKFLSLLNEDPDNLGLSYRYHGNKINYRLGLSYEQNTADDGIFDSAVKAGIDKYFKNFDRWRFYYGLDALVTTTLLSSSERRTTKFGGVIFFGALVHFGANFSLSTEPNLSLLRVVFRDEDDFSADANREWYEFELGNLGQIQASFHF